MENVIGMEAAGRSIRPVEIAFVAVVAASCLVANALAVICLAPLSAGSLGPLAVAYHPVAPPLVLIPVFLLILILLLRGSAAQGVRRAALITFTGAACANVISTRLWSAGAPDYIVFRNVDIVANLSDLIMTVSAAVVFGSIVVNAVRRPDVTDIG